MEATDARLPAATPTGFPSEAEIREVSAIGNGAARNRRITESYFRLSGEVARRLAGAANWCTFAAWASRQAGVTIRHEDLVEALRKRLRASERFRGLVGRLLSDIERREIDLVEVIVDSVSKLGPLARSAEAVARGNLKVYEEIGFEFSRFLTRFSDVGGIADQQLEEFCGALRDGDPPHGQALLRRAFRDYRSAARAGSSKERAEWTLLANLRIGLHEQIRLQPDIRAALDAATIEPGALVDLVLGALGRREGLWRRTLRRVLPSRTPLLHALAREVAEEVRAVVRQLVTEHLMSLTLGGDIVRLGAALTRPCTRELATLTNEDLLPLVRKIDPASGSEQRSGARDWSVLDDRMQFIADLFRAYQDDARLFSSPL